MFHLPIWGILLVILGFTHMTSIGVSLYLHRHLTHRCVELHPLVTHVLRFWLWISSGLRTKEWVAVHRKHHAETDTEHDPHSPQIYGIKTLLLEGVRIYLKECQNLETIRQYGKGTPQDWIERHLYGPYSDLGLFLMLLINIVLFGWLGGFCIWMMQIHWPGLTSSSLINGVGHYWGYRNFNTADFSHNIFPVGILLLGEEFHNNHHANPTCAKFSKKSWELDLGWCYIRLLEKLKLAQSKT